MSWERLVLRTVPEVAPTALPILIYGTAWKKDRTADLVYKALGAGFRAVDTAAQPKHYREDLVGDGIRRAIREGIVKREDLYVGGFVSFYFVFAPVARNHVLCEHNINWTNY
jgi:hypothetical protein